MMLVAEISGFDPRDKASAGGDSVPDESEPQDRGLTARRDKTNKILADADRRDDEATARDAVSDERAEEADRAAFLESGKKYPGHGERRAAALDRSHAKSDRESSAEDRAQLTADEDAPNDPSTTDSA